MLRDRSEKAARNAWGAIAYLGREASRVAFFNVGPYAFMLAVSRNNTLELYSGKDLDVAGYRKVVDAIAADLRAQLPE